MKHLVIGMGEVGHSILEFAKSNNCDIQGRDVDESGPREADVLHICYGYGNLFPKITAAYVNAYRPQICIIHSTVLPGTTDLVRTLTPKSVVAYSPVRGRHTDDGGMVSDLARYIKFYSSDDGFDDEVVRDALHGMGFRTGDFESSRALELAKLLETSYTGLLVAWSQEMNRFAWDQGADLRELHNFFVEIEHLPRYLYPPGHIGGHCIIQNMDILDELRDSPLLNAVRASNEARSLELSKAEKEKRHRPIPLGGQS
jgi:hypothetical protein